MLFDGDGLVGFGTDGLFTYDLTGGVLNALTPSSNGQLQYNEDTKQLGIFKFDNNGTDYRPTLFHTTSNNASGRVKITFPDELQHRTFEFDGTDSDAVYNGTYFRIPIIQINGGTAGDGSVVKVEIEIDNQIMGPGDAFRLPGGGETFDSVVTMLNGITGGITLNHGTGITTAGASATGITIGIDATSTIQVAGITSTNATFTGLTATTIRSTNGTITGATIGGVVFGGASGGATFSHTINTSANIVTSGTIKGNEATGAMSIDFTSAADAMEIGELAGEGNNTHILINDALSRIAIVAGTADCSGTFKSTGLLEAVAGISAAGATFTDIIRARGLTLGTAGVVFSDATTTTSAIRTEAYTGHIETAADKTYTIDPKVATARTITGFYIKSGSGTVTATLKNGSDTIKAASVSTSSGDQTSLANTSVSADAVLTLVTSSNSSATDVIFNIEYTS